MDIRFECLKCGRPMVADESASRQWINCPDCNEQLWVPAAPAKSAAAVPVPKPTDQRMDVIVRDIRLPWRSVFDLAFKFLVCLFLAGLVLAFLGVLFGQIFHGWLSR